MKPISGPLLTFAHSSLAVLVATLSVSSAPDKLYNSWAQDWFSFLEAQCPEQFPTLQWYSKKKKKKVIQ